MKLRFLACVLGLSLVAAGCDRTPENEVPETTTAMNEDFGATGTGGTTNVADESASVAEPAQDPTTSTAERGDASELPGTASPLGLAGLIGLLSLAGAAGARFLRRE